MVKLTKIYTRGGGKGQTSLGDGSRVDKDDLRVTAYGDVDETNATIGLALLHIDGDMEQMLARIQNDLFDLGADLCVPESADPKYPPLRIVEAQVQRLEAEIDLLNAALTDLNSFILPGGSAASAYLHLCRTVSRRAERHIVALARQEDINPAAIHYLNRLSDFFFVAARYMNDIGAADVLWTPGENR